MEEESCVIFISYAYKIGGVVQKLISFRQDMKIEKFSVSKVLS